MSFETLDWLVLGAFMLALLGIVVWVALQKEEDTEDYFLAGRNATWLAIGASIFASNIGSEHLVGLASAGAQYGMAMAHWEFHSWIILVLAWIFVPFYTRARIFTTPEFLERRYTPQTRTFFSLISLVVITGLYTVIGGMKAVLWTSVLQTPVLLLGSFIILFVGLTKLGAGAGLLEGWAVMTEINGGNRHLFRPIDDPMFPWPAAT